MLGRKKYYSTNFSSGNISGHFVGSKWDGCKSGRRCISEIGITEELKRWINGYFVKISRTI